MFLINQLNCYLDLGHVVNVITHFLNVLQRVITILEKSPKLVNPFSPGTIVYQR